MKRSLAFLKNIWDIYYEKRISRSAAALSYFLTLSLFPFLICMSELLTTLGVSGGFFMSDGYGIIPAETMEIIRDFVIYIDENHSTFMLTAAIVAFVTSASASFRQIMLIMDDIQGKTRYREAFRILFSILFSFAFPVMIYLIFVVMISGEWLLSKIGLLQLFGGLGPIWNTMRFLFIFLLLCGIIYGIYVVTAPKLKISHIKRWPGTLFAAAVLVGVSILFSWFIGASIRYKLLYGSVASVIILMIWLYICSTILILGNVVNVVLYNMKHRCNDED